MYKRILSLLVLSTALMFAATPILYRYRIFCVTESKNVYVWAETEPTACPNNTAHTINTNSISIVDRRDPNEVRINEETTPTGGHFKVETVAVPVAGGVDVVTTATKSWFHPVSILTFNFGTTADHQGDIITIDAPSDFTIGVITQAVAPGATVIQVSQSAIDIIGIGYYVKLDNGTNASNLGRVLAMNKVTRNITVETATTNGFLVGTPTQVKISVRTLDAYEIAEPSRYKFGASKFRGIYIPANAIVKISYTNKAVTSKRLVVDLEYLY